jgi:hypothetical protein
MDALLTELHCTSAQSVYIPEKRQLNEYSMNRIPINPPFFTHAAILDLEVRISERQIRRTAGFLSGVFFQFNFNGGED